MSRIHIIIDEAEKERFRQQAATEGLTLTEWLRAAARDRLGAAAGSPIESVEQLRDFFARCDGRERQTEPDWEEHRLVIDRSIASGRGGV
jgi:hypothetical protein